MLTEDSQGLHPLLHTVAVKDGFGGATKCLQPNLACKKIREMSEKALKQDLSHAGITLPEEFTFEVSYKEHKNAVSKSFYPGFQLVDSHTIRMVTKNYTDILRAVLFCL